jgi:hypothetical protein
VEWENLEREREGERERPTTASRMWGLILCPAALLDSVGFGARFVCSQSTSGINECQRTAVLHTWITFPSLLLIIIYALWVSVSVQQNVWFIFQVAYFAYSGVLSLLIPTFIKILECFHNRCVCPQWLWKHWEVKFFKFQGQSRYFIYEGVSKSFRTESSRTTTNIR